MSKYTNLCQKISIYFENREVLKLFRFSYKIVKTANSKTALTSDNTWIWRLKFGLRVQNQSYSILFTHFFDFKRKWFHMYRANIYIARDFRRQIWKLKIKGFFDVFSVIPRLCCKFRTLTITLQQKSFLRRIRCLYSKFFSS